MGDLVTNHSDRRVNAPDRLIAPVVIAGLAWRKADAVAGGVRALPVGTTGAREYENA